MTEQDFLQKMQEDILDTDEELTMDTTLNDIEEWDSLSYVSFVALAKMNGVAVERSAIRNAETIGDLFNLLQK